MSRSRKARPNPSFEARPNGKPPGPGRWYAYIFTGPGLASCRWSRLNSNVRPRKTLSLNHHMLRLTSILAIHLLLSGLQAQAQEVAPIPDWVRNRIAEFKATSANPAATAVWRVKFKGEDAYLFFSPCCDQFNYLYNAVGARLCAPSGGITGSGDGGCPDALRSKESVAVIWPIKGINDK